MSSENVLRLALVGGGLFARNNHLPQLLKLSSIIRVVAVWSNSKNSAVQTASLFAPYVSFLNKPLHSSEEDFS